MVNTNNSFYINCITSTLIMGLFPYCNAVFDLGKDKGTIQRRVTSLIILFSMSLNIRKYFTRDLQLEVRSNILSSLVFHLMSVQDS